MTVRCDPGLSPDVTVHCLAVKPHIRPGPSKRLVQPGVESLITVEIEKLKAAKFI